VQVVRHPTKYSGLSIPQPLSESGTMDEAEKLFVQVTVTSKKVLGPEHPDTLISKANLAST